MFKAMILLTRKEDMSRATFEQWWQKEHAPLARQLPGLQRATFNLVTEGSENYDGISELWFQSRQDFNSTYSSDTGKSVAEDSLANVAYRERLFFTETHILGSA